MDDVINEQLQLSSILVVNVNCGSHLAYDCDACPQGHGSSWCHGDCIWISPKCTPKGKI